MIDQTILEATSASSNNPAALSALALILLSLAEPISSRTQSELDELIGKWARTLHRADIVVVDGLIAQLRAAGATLGAPIAPLKQAI